MYSNLRTPKLKEIVSLLNEQYNSNRNSFIINKVAGGFQIVTRKQYKYFIKKLLKKSNRLKLSMAAMDSFSYYRLQTAN